MEHKCVVPNCNSGTKSSAEKVDTFKAPSDPERLTVWASAIRGKDRELRSTDHVCKKHFTDDMIGGELGGVVHLDEPVLHPEAIPCIFPEVSSHLSVAKTKRAPQETAASIRDNSAKRAKLGCSIDHRVDDVMRRGRSDDEFSGEADSNSSPQTSSECGDETCESLQPVLHSGVVKSERFGGPSEGSGFARPVESSPSTQSSTRSPVHSNVVKSEPLTEASSEECEPVLRADANLCLESSCQTYVFSNVVKSEPFTEPSSEACVPATHVTFASPMEPSVQSPLCASGVKSEPSTESGNEEFVSVTPAQTTFSVESSCQSPVHSNVVRNEPFTKPSSEECVPTSPVETDIPLESRGQGPESSSAVTNGHPAGANDKPAPQKSSLPPEDKEQTCSCGPRRTSEQRRVILPSPAWKPQEISVDGAQSLCFVELRKASPTSPVFVFKSLEVAVAKEGLKITKCVLGRVVASAVVQVFPSTKFVPYISSMLSSLDKQAVCCGGPACNEYPDIRLWCASVDAIGFWRHDMCTLCVDGTVTRCVHCTSLSEMVRLHVERKKREEEEEEHARLLLRLSERSEREALGDSEGPGSATSEDSKTGSEH